MSDEKETAQHAQGDAVQRQPPSYPVHQSAAWAGSTFLASLPIDLLCHFGWTGLFVGGLASYAAWRHGPELAESMREMFSPASALLAREMHREEPAPKEEPRIPQGEGKKRGWLDRALGYHPEQEEQATASSGSQRGSGDMTDDDEETAIFQASDGARNAPLVPRITLEQAVRYTTRNSYEVYLGRSLTRPKYPALKINFYKRHIKIIGASQYGKSSMAAFLLEAIIRTHDPDHVMIVLLDMEHKTSRLFAEVSHLAELVTDQGTLVLHAKNEREVLAHLHHLVALVKYRYTLPETELDRLPLLIVYLEEFIDLKDSFKNRIQQAKGEAERAQATRDYNILVYCIKHLARRGLKAHVQLLMCAQVDYRDDDLQEALVNVTSGLAFCLRPSAAQAAGFYQTQLIRRNAEQNQVGVAVVEMPEHKDLVLAPEYDLREKLRKLPRPMPPLPTKEKPAGQREYSPSPSPTQTPSSEHDYAPLSTQHGEQVNAVNGLRRPVNGGESFTGNGEYSRESGERFTPSVNPEPSASYTPEEEVQVLLAYAELCKTSEKVTRTGIRDKLGWNNKQYSRVVMPVCDKHQIAL
jgi:hypothetical protein